MGLAFSKAVSLDKKFKQELIDRSVYYVANTFEQSLQGKMLKYNDAFYLGNNHKSVCRKDKTSSIITYEKYYARTDQYVKQLFFTLNRYIDTQDQVGLTNYAVTLLTHKFPSLAMCNTRL